MYVGFPQGCIARRQKGWQSGVPPIASSGQLVSPSKSLPATHVRYTCSILRSPVSHLISFIPYVLYPFKGRYYTLHVSHFAAFALWLPGLFALLSQECFAKAIIWSSPQSLVSPTVSLFVTLYTSHVSSSTIVCLVNLSVTSLC